MRRRNRLYLPILLSMALHLLLLWLFRDWGEERIRAALRPATLPSVPSASPRFQPQRQPVLSQATMEMIRRSTDADDLASPALPGLEDPLRYVRRWHRSGRPCPMPTCRPRVTAPKVDCRRSPSPTG
ncbi:MAG: hypothetical protein QF689_00460 [Candidatus Latescibacteria bacterium]|nr:hypothetical protein [Candidatus Latescibacterota bacterium]